MDIPDHVDPQFRFILTPWMEYFESTSNLFWLLPAIDLNFIINLALICVLRHKKKQMDKTEQLDYDIHLKPATGIKKAKGEDAAIEYLFDLFTNGRWDDYSKYSILDKMRGYFKKAKPEFQNRIEEELQKLAAVADNTARHYTYSALAKIYSVKKDVELEYQMLGNAIRNVHADDTSYLIEVAQYIERQIPILGTKDLSERDNAENYLYWLLTYHLWMMAWWTEVDKRGGIVGEIQTNWRNKVDNTDFPYDYYTSLKAFNTLNGINVRQCASRFQTILFDEWPNSYLTLKHQSECIDVVSNIVNGYIREW